METTGEAIVRLVRLKGAVEQLYQSEAGQAIVLYLQAQRLANRETLETSKLDDLNKIAKIQGENHILNDLIGLPEQLKQYKLRE